VADIIYDDDPAERVSPAGRILEQFAKALADLEDAISEAVMLRRMQICRRRRLRSRAPA